MNPAQLPDVRVDEVRPDHVWRRHHEAMVTRHRARIAMRHEALAIQYAQLRSLLLPTDLKEHELCLLTYKIAELQFLLNVSF